MRAFAILLSAGTLLALSVTPCRADMIGAVNSSRITGCGGKPGVRELLVENAQLNTAARRMAQGATLHDAVGDAGYHGVKSTSVRMSGWLTETAVGRAFRQRFCTYLIDPQLTEVGVYKKSGGVWFILAQPLPLRALGNANSVNYRVFTLINEARAKARRCGRDSFAAAGPLVLSDKLSRAALEHSKDMAKRNYFEHAGSDGSQPADRATRQNYKWLTVGENIAAGATTPEDAVKGWIASPHHCANLMNPRFTETGVGYAVRPDTQYGIYWTQLFAKPH